MRRFIPVLLALMIAPFATLGAQEVTFQGRIEEVRSYADPEGFFLENLDPILLADDVTVENLDGGSLSLAALSDLVFEDRNRIGIVATTRDDERIEHILVLGIDGTPPRDLQDNQRSFNLFFVDTREWSVTPSPIPFVEIVPTTIDARGTNILDEEGLRISINDLKQGTVVEVVASLGEQNFIASEVRILSRVEHRNFWGVIIRIKSEGSGLRLFFKQDDAKRVDSRAPVIVDGEDRGPGLHIVAEILDSTDEPVTVTLSNRDFFDPNGKWGRVELVVGKSSVGSYWGDSDEVTFQLAANSDDAVWVSEDGENNLLFAVQPQFRVDESTQVTDRTMDVNVPIGELTEFMNLNINYKTTGTEIFDVNISIDERPREVTLDLTINWTDPSNKRIGFNQSTPVQMVRNPSLTDFFGNRVDLQQFNDAQWEGGEHLSALITLNSDGLGVEGQLVLVGTSSGQENEVLVGEVAGVHLGFGVNFEESSLYTPGINGILTPSTIVQGPNGEALNARLLTNGVAVTVWGALSGGTLFMREITLRVKFESFDITARINSIDLNERRLYFDEPDPIPIAEDAQLFDHFGDPASLSFLEDLLRQAQLQFLLTMDGRGPNDEKAASRVEAFRSDDQVFVGDNQVLINAGHIDRWPPQVVPEGVKQVFYNRDTVILDVNGGQISPNELEERVEVRVTGQFIEREKRHPNDSPRSYFAETIEVLGGVAIDYRGTLSEVVGNTLLFEPPAPLFITGQTDLRDEFGFPIDFFSLGDRILSENGLRIRIGADFFSQGNPRVWWAQIMHPDEPSPSNLGSDQIVGVFVDADFERRSILAAPTPSIELGDNTVITDRSGEEQPVDVLAPGAEISVLAENRNGTLVAVKIEVEEVPETFEFTSAVDYIDFFSRNIYFSSPPFITVDQNANITDRQGNSIDMSELRRQMSDLPYEDRILAITQAPDSPSDVPIATAVRIVDVDAPSQGGPDEFIVFVDEPRYRIGVQDRRIEPSPLPPVGVDENAEILGLDGQSISLDDISEGSRISVKGKDSRGFLVATEIKVVGGMTFTDEATIGEIDVANRTITPAAEPPLTIDPFAYISDTEGRRLTLSILDDYIRREPFLLLAIEFNPFGPGIVSINLINPEFGFGPMHDQFIVDGESVEIDVDNFRIIFQPDPPGSVAEDAIITGPDGESLTLADLEPGQRVYVRGEELGEDFIVTAITVIPRIDFVDLIIQVGDFDEEGVDNDVLVQVQNQDGREINLPIRIFVDFSPPVETRSGHIFSNLPKGPHAIEVEVPSVGHSSRARIFIKASGTAFRIEETRPADGETGVAQVTDISITFSEALQQFGDYIPISGALIPAPESGDLGKKLEVEKEGRTVTFRDVELAENTDYTLAINSATSKSGSVLQPFQIQFSTGGVLAQLGSLRGTISLTDNLLFIGTIRLFDEAGNAVTETTLDTEGAFALENIFEGTYRLSVQISAEDGRSVSGFLDDDGDGTPDNVSIDAGENLSDLDISLSLPEIVEPGSEGGPNKDVAIALDLDARSDNQELDELSVLPDTEIRVAVYASDVTDLIGFNLSLSYDTTAVSFQSVSEDAKNEDNLLKGNGGMAVALPPSVQAGIVEFASAILGATDETVATGSGVLAEFRFKTKQNFSNPTEFLVARVLLVSQSASDTSSVLARATVTASTDRILLRVSADPDTIDADGSSTSTIGVAIRNADGETYTKEIAVGFEIVSGTGNLSSTTVTTSDGSAQTRLTGTTAGTVEVQVTAQGISEKVNVVMEEAEIIDSGGGDGTALTPAEGSGEWAMDLDTGSGDQEVREKSIKPGEEFTVQIINNQSVSPALGGSFTMQFDSEKLEALTSSITGIAGQLGAPVIDGNTLRFTLAGLSGVPVVAGYVGEITFKALDDFDGETEIILTKAAIGDATSFANVESEPNNSVVVRIGEASESPTPDFDGDGTVGFRDFIMFAQKYGAVAGDGSYEARFDLDSNGDVGFRDFILFAQVYGKPASEFVAPKYASKSALAPSSNATATLDLATIKSADPNTVLLDLNLSNAEQVSGYSLQVEFDASALEWVSAVSLVESRFHLGGTDQAVSLTKVDEGKLLLADLLTDEVQGNARLVRLTFRVLDKTAGSTVDISQALISNPAGGISQLLGAHTADVRAIPETFELGQNFPNPFNPETVVPFAVPETGDVRVSIYNVLGQEIRTLVDNNLPAGFHRIVWDGKDLQGKTLASGIYFVRMSAERFTDVRKMMLLK